MSASHKLVARYLLANEHEFVFKTAGEIAMIIGVSESTVVRFAGVIGFSNYSEMQRYMQREYMRNAPSSERVSDSMVEDGSVLENAVKRDISYLMKLLRPQFQEDFMRAAEMIVGAKRIYVGGSRGASSLAANFFYNINYMKSNVISLTGDAGDWQNLMLDCDQDSLLIAVIMPKYSKRTCDMIRFARKLGGQVLTVTDSKISPAAELADCVLACEIGLEYFIWSSTIVVSVLNALLVQVARLNQPAVLERMKKMDNMIAKIAPQVYEGA